MKRPRFWRPHRWHSLDTPGFELMELSESSRHIEMRGMLVAEVEGQPIGASYHMKLGADWVFEALNLRLLDGRSLKLRSDGKGRWTENDGAPRPDLADCIDIDLSGSPVTNSLPINRARLKPGEAECFTMAYIDLLSLNVTPFEQEYERLADRRFRYLSVASGFAADLSVDSDGLVTDYPGVFRKLET